MKVDDQTEEKVRNALHWAVKRREHEFDASLATFSTRSERSTALELLIAVSRFVTSDICAGVPSSAQVTALAAEISATESWSTVSTDEITAFLTLAARDDPAVDGLSAETFVVTAFVVTASLLAMRPKQEGQWWFDYLDQVESALEATG
ncbi:hypothetical protein AWW66_04025 [Micromonospora rosaria]|uniref:Uncharacterized protein n=1 Tax=Micromonospora rosaria TaxID=47874 RepID=A0A136PXW7_9ACTN|nr:hypothetical protein [Micromonospora rosaria]KXK63275.1 hypothetical protein AWW66_04025 [Micromonospora rosaria]